MSDFLSKLKAEGDVMRSDQQVGQLDAIRRRAMGTPSREFTVASSRRARNEAIKRVDENADAIWKREALEAVKRTARALPDFISDDVWSTGHLESNREDRALGPIFLRAAREGWIVKSDRVRPSVRSHGSGKTVWLSQLYEGSVAA